MKDNVAISVTNVTKEFRVPHERYSSLKQSILNTFSPKSYSKFNSVSEVSFEIKKGEFFGIVGRNGCGKSTLLKMIAGIYTTTKGDIKVNGTLSPFIELGVGFNPELTGRENIFLSGTILGMKRKVIEQRFDSIVEFSELGEFIDQKLKNYSSGMHVRLAFSIAVQAQSDIMLIDEVLAVGDAAFQQKCFTYFQKLKEEGKTICFVTHDMGAVQRFCDRGIIIENGRIKIIGDPATIANEYIKDNTEQSIRISKKSNHKNSNISRISVEVVKKHKDANKTVFKMKYKNAENVNTYVGLSIIKGGATVAEVNSIGKESKAKDGSISYSLDSSLFNPGLYEVSAALINYDTDALICLVDSRKQFVIKGFDKKRGGAIKLADSWISNE